MWDRYIRVRLYSASLDASWRSGSVAGVVVCRALAWGRKLLLSIVHTRVVPRMRSI